MPDDGIRAARDKSSVCCGEPERTPENDKRSPRSRRQSAEAPARPAPTQQGAHLKFGPRHQRRSHQKQGANRRHAGSRRQRVAEQDRRSQRSFVERRRRHRAVGAIARYRSGRSARNMPHRLPRPGLRQFWWPVRLVGAVRPSRTNGPGRDRLHSLAGMSLPAYWDLPDRRGQRFGFAALTASNTPSGLRHDRAVRRRLEHRR